LLEVDEMSLSERARSGKVAGELTGNPITGGNGGFGARLCAGRMAAGFSQDELAERSGLSSRTIRNLESGRTSLPYRDTLRRLADALELSDAARTEFLGTLNRRLTSQAAAMPATGAAEIRVDSDADRPGWLPAVPRQLPGEVRRFVGRADELARLGAVAGEAVQATSAVIAVIAGKAGVGKTALAVHWARQAAGRFPGGQLFADLRGFDPSGIATDPDSVLASFLDALGVIASRMPASLDAKAALYRSLMHGRRMLVVLENARDAAQVMPLLPAGSGCMAVVTSRRLLDDLIVAKEATLLTVEVMSPPEAYMLLAARLGGGPAAAGSEHAAALIGHGELIELCGGLPLALCIVAARILAHPNWPATAVAGVLREAHERDVPIAGRQAIGLHAVFSWSYRQLSRPAAAMFRLLGICPGTDIELAAAASLAGVSVPAARDAVDELVSVHLIEENAPGRFTVHDLLRAYAARLCHSTDAPMARSAAMTRLLDYYLHASHAAASECPNCFALEVPVPTPGNPCEEVVRREFRDLHEARDWIGSVRSALVATVVTAAGTSQRHAIGIALALHPFLRQTGHWNDGLTTARIALTAARRLGDLTGEAHAHCNLGSAYLDLGDCHLADQHLREALACCRETGCHRILGVIYTQLMESSNLQRQPAEALRFAYRSLESFRAAGFRPGEAYALNNASRCQLKARDAQAALSLLDQALGLHRDRGDEVGQAYAWDTVGYAHHLLGNQPEAISWYRRALLVSRESANLALTAAILNHTGDAHHAAGHDDDARSCRQEALSILSDLGVANAGLSGRDTA
jgi:transcriptional regulator with XRE-family HTH domain/tetratricopeptide (TPR) repeat protein